jgi:hypothetical protein
MPSSVVDESYAEVCVLRIRKSLGKIKNGSDAECYGVRVGGVFVIKYIPF